MQIIDGKLISRKVKSNVKEEVSSIAEPLCLLVILVGDDPASKIYVAAKEKACLECNILPKTIILKSSISEQSLLEVIDQANNDDSVTAILVQMPLPKHINEKTVIERIKSAKDVDGLNALNQGRLLLGEKGIIPATPKGVIRLLTEYNIDIEGKKALVIGRSMLVGKPVALLLLQKNATVTIAHSKTKNLSELAKTMDIIVCAIGKANFLTADMIKEGAVIIDVGINRLNGKVVGDVDFLAVSQKAGFLTPVPGGVGPMTIASLLENVVECYKLQK